MKAKYKSCIITLGCPKNVVESEKIAGLLTLNKRSLTSDISKANEVLIHTCSFINDAKCESYKAIEYASKLKAKKKIKKIYVTGCLVQDEGKSLLEKYPLIDAIVGTGEIGNLNKVLLRKSNALIGAPGGFTDPDALRLISPAYLYAYVSIAEGCSHKCTFCAIPGLRGPYKSTRESDILSEVRELKANGIKEVILIAQDTTLYGRDLAKKYKLSVLLKKIAEQNKDIWIRLLYAYPQTLAIDVVKVIAEYDNIVKYIDLPLQHIALKVLSKMKRPLNASRAVIKIKKALPGVSLRTAFIVGFPGETEKDFKALLSFVKKGYFDNLGVFKFSLHKDTPASGYPNQIKDKVKKLREKKLMLAQKKVVADKLKGLKNKVFKVLIERKIDKDLYAARTYFQAPEIDGITYVSSSKPLEGFVDVKVTGFKGYDLMAVTHRA